MSVIVDIAFSMIVFKSALLTSDVSNETTVRPSEFSECISLIDFWAK